MEDIDNLNIGKEEVERDNDCIFCKIAKKEIPKELTYEDDNFIAFLDINPKSEGHTLIIPKKHYKTLLDMPNTLGNELQETIKKVSLDLVKKHDVGGFNFIINSGEVAGQVVHHLHVHVIPRKNDDDVNFIC